MSRIDTAGKAAILQSQMEPATKAENSSAAAKAAGVRKLWKSREATPGAARSKSKRAEKLSSIREVSASDIQHLSRRKQDQVIAELSRVVLFLEAEARDGAEDEASHLCRVMLQENIRRLMLVRDVQSDSLTMMGAA